jgi:hypothetical protein
MIEKLILCLYTGPYYRQPWHDEHWLHTIFLSPAVITRRGKSIFRILTIVGRS